MKKRIITTVLLFLSTICSADPVELKFAAWGPSFAPMNVATTEWANKVNEDSGGKISVSIHWNTLGNAVSVYRNIEAGVADIGWVLQPFVRGQFPKTSIVEIPGLFSSSEHASQFLWSLYQSGVLADEYGEIVPLAIVALTPSRLHTSRFQPSTLSSIKGKKFRVAGKTMGHIVAKLGAVPVQLPWVEIKEGLARGTIDGTFSPWNDFVPVGLSDVTSFHLDHDFGMIAGLIAMNKSKYESLPEGIREIIDRNSGISHSAWLGSVADQNMEENRKSVGRMDSHLVVQFSHDEKAKMDVLLKPLEREWASRIENGEEILKMAKESNQK